MNCPACKTFNDENASYCRQCGWGFPLDSVTQPTEMVCPACSNKGNNNDQFCNNCGTTLVSNPTAHSANTFCPNCGAKTNKNDRFCRSCGFTVSDSTPSRPKSRMEIAWNEAQKEHSTPRRPKSRIPSASSSQNSSLRSQQHTDVPNHLGWAILATLFCCLIPGIVSIVYAAQVNGRIEAGDLQGAMHASENAKTWAWIAFALGIAIGFLWLFIVIL